MVGKILLYGHSGCPSVPLVRTLLEKSGVTFEYINIRIDETGRSRVRELNNGYESVPTLVFPDATTLTEPSSRVLRDKLIAMGCEVQVPEWIRAFEQLLGRIRMRRPLP